MAVNIGDCEAYIAQFCITTEYWDEADFARKTRLMNVAERTLTTKFSDRVIPDNAVYEFANTLATSYSDINKLKQEGVSGVNISGVASYTFSGGDKSLEDMIPKVSIDLINEANPDLPKVGGRLKWTVL